jgi:hypothetical protein
MLFFGPIEYRRLSKMANLDNILPILVIFCKEITKHLRCDIFWIFYIQKIYFYIIAYLRCA